MAGNHFTFDNFEQLLSLNIGIADRLDENRAESFTLLYCDFLGIAPEIVDEALLSILRTSDSIVNYENNYFFILPYTDKYGAEIVKKNFDEFFAKFLPSFLVSYPIDGENVKELLSSLQDSTSYFLKNDLPCLNQLTDVYH